MPAVATGKLRHWVEFQRQQQSQDSTTGEIVTAWVTVFGAWAEVRPLSAREFRDAQAKQSEVRGHMTLRYREDIDATMRGVYRGKFYDILGVLPDEDSGREHITLPTAEGVSLGG